MIIKEGDMKTGRNSTKKEFTKIEFDQIFWPWFTPKWFEFLSWILIMGLFEAVFKKTHNFFVGSIYAASNAFLLNYMVGKLNNYFVNVRFIFYNRKGRIIFATIVSCIILFAVFVFTNKAIDQLISAGSL